MKIDLFKEFLSNHSSLSDIEISTIVSCFTKIEISRNQFLTREGEIEKHLYFVLEGAQRAYFIKDETEYSIAFSFIGSFSGVVDSFLTQKKSYYYLQAISDSTFLRASYETIINLYEKFPKFRELSNKMMLLLMEGRFKRERELISFSAKERYERFIHESPKAEQLIPQKYIASYLHMSPETYSRLRKRS